ARLADGAGGGSNMVRYVACLAVLLASTTAYAQEELPKGTGAGGAGPASKGTTDVATGGFEAAGKVEDQAKANDATELSAAAGVISNSGNSTSFAATANVTGRIRRGDEQFSGIFAANYARAKAPDQPEARDTVENQQLKLRYDHFITKDLVLFLGV